MSKEILVSIITPNYNCCEFIGQTIESVMKQSYCNWEMIIVDDCSTDKSLEIIKKYIRLDKRIKLIRNKINRGVSYSRNKGIKIASGKYIMFLDSDDIFHENKILKQITYMEKNKIDFTCTNYNRIKESGEKIGEIKAPLRMNYNEVLKNCLIGCSTSCFIKNKFQDIKFEDIRLEDLQFWLEILKREKYVFGIQESLVNYKVRENSRSSNKIRNVFSMFSIYYSYQKLGFFKSLYLLSVYVVRWIKRNKFNLI